MQSHKPKKQQDKHKKYETKARPIKKKDSSSKDTKKKSQLKKILKNKMASKKTHASDPISATIKNFDHQKQPRSSKSVKKTEIKPITKQFYSGDPADILEGDDDEDAISYSRGRSQ